MASETCGLEQISLESFKLWSTNALKSFLRVRKNNDEGTFEEFVARYCDFGWVFVG